MTEVLAVLGITGGIINGLLGIIIMKIFSDMKEARESVLRVYQRIETGEKELNIEIKEVRKDLEFIKVEIARLSGGNIT